jgi:hypothetical protein
VVVVLVVVVGGVLESPEPFLKFASFFIHEEKGRRRRSLRS